MKEEHSEMTIIELHSIKLTLGYLFDEIYNFTSYFKNLTIIALALFLSWATGEIIGLAICYNTKYDCEVSGYDHLVMARQSHLSMDRDLVTITVSDELVMVQRADIQSCKKR